MDKSTKTGNPAEKRETKTTSPFRRTSMVAIVLNVGVFVALCCLFLIYVPPEAALLYGLVVYFAWSALSKLYFLRHQRTGMKLVNIKQFEAAQKEFEASFAYFCEYPLLDQHRSVFMLDISEIPYTEMSLNNIAYCQCKLGNLEGARTSYEKLKRRYPNSELAKIGFENLERMENSRSEQTAEAASPTD